MDRSGTRAGARRRKRLAHRRVARDARRGTKLIVLDTSALTKLVVTEPQTPALIRALHGRVVIASDLVRPELRRAVARTAPELGEQAEALLERLLLVRLDARVLDAAGDLGPPELRTLDAIHIQCARILGDDLDAFVTYDERQATAARAAGLPVEQPG